MIYTHVLNKGGKSVLSPLDGMHATPMADLTMAKRQEETDEPE
jgi:hypothetical protein